MIRVTYEIKDTRTDKVREVSGYARSQARAQEAAWALVVELGLDTPARHVVAVETSCDQ